MCAGLRSCCQQLLPVTREASKVVLRAMSLAASPAVIKPPNVLVLQPQSAERDSGTFLLLKDGLSACLNPEKYIIYPLGLQDVLRTPWKENCSLLVVPSRLKLAPPQVYHEIASFVHGGGVLLSLEANVNVLLGFRLDQHLKPNDLIKVMHVCETEEGDSANRFHLLSISTIEDVDDVQFAQEIPFDPGVFRENLAYLTLPSDASPMHHSLELMEQSPDSTEAEFPRRIPCVQCVRFSKSGQALLSYVDLLSASHEGNDLSLLLHLKKDIEPRQVFLRSALRRVGLECTSEAIPELSHTYLVCSPEVTYDLGD